MEELILSKWDEILSLLETEHGLSPIVVKTWIKPLKLYSVEGKKLYFAVDDSMGSRAIDFINKKMYDMFLVTSIKEVLDDDSIEIVIDVESNLNKTSKEEVTKEEYNEAITKSNLYPKYTFDTFVVGESNKARSCNMSCCRRFTGTGQIQPTVFIWWSRSWQNTSDAVYCTLYFTA